MCTADCCGMIKMYHTSGSNAEVQRKQPSSQVHSNSDSIIFLPVADSYSSSVTQYIIIFRSQGAGKKVGC